MELFHRYLLCVSVCVCVFVPMCACAVISMHCKTYVSIHMINIQKNNELRSSARSYPCEYIFLCLGKDDRPLKYHRITADFLKNVLLMHQNMNYDMHI